MDVSTAQKMKSFMKDFFSKCDQIRRKLWVWPHLLNKSLIENFIFCTVFGISFLLPSLDLIVIRAVPNVDFPVCVTKSW